MQKQQTEQTLLITIYKCKIINNLTLRDAMHESKHTACHDGYFPRLPCVLCRNYLGAF